MNVTVVDSWGLANTVVRRFGGENRAWLADSAVSIPILVTMAVWGGAGYTMVLFVAGINAIPDELYEPLIIIRTEELFNLPIALSNLSNAIVSSPGSMGVAMAASMMATLPTVVFFFLFQKHFIKGIALSGIKA
ncbi:hypothetical protein [Glycomyces sambucus]|uniref:hypothetical protein n=1 Tax=Glycomyces sambucus TaxID=380244 RepID=UPI000B849BF4|nr:hypothetical protein [Glycomyces sambucus]